MARGLFGMPEAIHIGFTGNQDGQTSAQKQSVHDLLLKHQGTHFHHGDCIGSDEQAHAIALALNYAVIIHPPVDPRKRAYCKGATAVREEKPYLKRNSDILKECSIVIATPRSYKEVVRSGTWSTVRRAVDLKRKVLVVFRDGRVVERIENPDLSTLEDSE
jgi:hypothetical protein